MPDLGTLQRFLDGGRVDAAVFALRPDYRALLVAADGLARRASDAAGAPAAADDLVSHLLRLGPDVRTARRLIRAGTAPDATPDRWSRTC